MGCTLCQIFFSFFGCATWHAKSSATRDKTCAHCSGREDLGHWTIREAPDFFFFKEYTLAEHVCVCVCVGGCVCLCVYKIKDERSFAATWMDLEIIMLSEVSQTKTTIT